MLVTAISPAKIAELTEMTQEAMYDHA